MNLYRNLDRKSAERVRAQYSGFYRYLRGICALRTLNPGDTSLPPYMEAPRERPWVTDPTALLLLLPLVANPSDPTQDKTEDYYKGFLLLCGLCNVVVRSGPSSSQRILALPIDSIKHRLDALIFRHHSAELVYTYRPTERLD